MAKDDKVDNSENTSQTESGKCKQCIGKKEETEAQNPQHADNAPKPPIVTNPIVEGSNNNNKELIAELIPNTGYNDNIDFLSELLNNHSLISDAERKDDMMTKKHTN